MMDDDSLLIPTLGRTLSDVPAEEPDAQTRPVVWGAITGGGSYLLVPEFVGLARAGTADETLGLGLGLAAALLAKSFEPACEPSSKLMPWLQGAGGGLVGMAALVPVAGTLGIVMPPLGIAAALAGGAIAGGGLATSKQLRAIRQATKQCPLCGRKGLCPNRVCPYCFGIYNPLAVGDERCRDGGRLGGAEIASLLQERYRHGLHKVDHLMKEYSQQNGPHRGHSLSQDKRTLVDRTTGTVVVECAPFLEWLTESGGLRRADERRFTVRDARDFLQTLQDYGLIREVPKDLSYEDRFAPSEAD